VFVVLLALLVLPVRVGAASDETDGESKPKFEQSWQVLMIAGDRIGYAHATSRERRQEGETVFESDSLTYMKIVRFGQTLEMKQSMHLVETSDGKLLRFTTVADNPPDSRVATTGTVEGDSLTVVTKAAGTERTTVLQGMKEVLSPGWPERWLGEHRLDVGETTSFEVYEPQFGKRASVTFTRREDTTTGMLDGAMAEVRHLVMTQSVPGSPELAIDMYLDDSWETVKTRFPLLGLETYEVSEEEALKEFSGEADIAISTMVRVPPIESAHTAKEITYRIRVDGTDPRTLFSAGATQTIEPINENEINLTVRSLRPRDRAGQPTPEPVAEEYLRPTGFLEADDEIVRKLAAEAVGEATDPIDKALAMETFVGKLVEDKNFSTSMATAAEVARSRSGDCTEHAVLLAAMLRAESIPSRVVIGFVYSEPHSAFVGHMWTEAHLGGEWVPLDATLAGGGIGAGHLKVSHSSLADAGNAPVAEFLPLIHLLGRMSIEVPGAPVE
jgi:hypothetical protein